MPLRFPVTGYTLVIWGFSALFFIQRKYGEILTVFTVLAAGAYKLEHGNNDQ
jgi:hypothetical protein